ncbi:STAS domain-containing protein [Virgisporangium aurantiacum]|uniref:Anti-sigma factor antagonist n=1 Tax=Virgisporangium aurantiacum TaxID=175570 RepID=A0A8J4E676_9ACTN|nr:STAS domain-containing protein [Virgisporangium aurantiacum]GIJ60567.1 anti-sigma factor antagonist [Virgisporangium aurantiacum]
MTGAEAHWGLAVEHQPGHTVLRVSGDLDLETAPRLLAVAEPHLAAAGANLIIDLSALNFIDSSGLSALIRINKRAAATDRTLAIIAPAPQVAKAFEITGLDQILPLRRSA